MRRRRRAGAAWPRAISLSVPANDRIGRIVDDAYLPPLQNQGADLAIDPNLVVVPFNRPAGRHARSLSAPLITDELVDELGHMFPNPFISNCEIIAECRHVIPLHERSSRRGQTFKIGTH